LRLFDALEGVLLMGMCHEPSNKAHFFKLLVHATFLRPILPFLSACTALDRSEALTLLRAIASRLKLHLMSLLYARRFILQCRMLLQMSIFDRFSHRLLFADQAHLARMKARTDAECYKATKEAEANAVGILLLFWSRPGNGFNH